MHTEPAADPDAVTLLREAARDALALGDAAAASDLLSRASTSLPLTGIGPRSCSSSRWRSPAPAHKRRSDR
jgi:hypothetical protein